MKQEFANKWVEALRSGTYAQGKSCLHEEETNRFCCLGVLCDLVKEEVEGKWVPLERDTESTSMGFQVGIDPFNYVTSFLPMEVVKHVGMRSGTGSLPGNPSLFQLNDNGTSFEEIATHIETNYEKL